jgi:hypothetical protein
LTGKLMRHTMPENQPEGIMSTLNQVVRQLHVKRRQTEQELGRIDRAIKALTSLGGILEPTVRRKHKMSAAGRAAIAKAQRERWAKLKAKPGKRKMSRAGRLAIARAKKAWWAKKKAGK